jgi:hypothetical protein
VPTGLDHAPADDGDVHEDERQARQDKLDKLVTKMDEAKGEAKVTAMSAVIHELLSERTQAMHMMGIRQSNTMGQQSGMMGQQPGMMGGITEPRWERACRAIPQ